VQAFVAREYQQKIESFVVGGASKRGWTTWLTAAVDPRVKGIAPMVIDMLNMKVQLDWMKKIYGQQSEKIHDYTQLKLQERQDEPAVVRLRGWVDPYSYRARYTMPKLLLLGSNDPYWTVDSLRHYWTDLPGPKLVMITPNAGHDLAGGRDSLPALSAFFEMLADNKPLPQVDWQIGDTGHGQAEVTVKVNQPARSIRLWTASSADRDFRESQWTSKDLPVKKGSAEATALVPTPPSGYRAYMAEIVLTSPAGHPYKLSTEARVTPDKIK
jgi:PhoPQ-activated pathogenicity-related protein